MKNVQKGFTLIELMIELMIVVAIIGILAAVAIPAYQQHQIKEKCKRSPDSPACEKAKADYSSSFVATSCRAGFQFDIQSNRQIIGANGGGVPCN